MTDAIETAAPVVIPTQQSAGFVAPSVGADGVPLSMQAQFQELLKNPQFREEALTVGTPAAAWVQKMNEQAAGVAPLAPPVASGPPVPIDKSVYDLGNGPYELTPEQLQADSLARSWLSTAGIDGPTGSSLASYVTERAGQLRGATADDLAAEASRTVDTIAQHYGPEAVQAKVDLARRFVQLVEAEHPGLVHFLDASGLANDPLLTLRLIGLAEERGL